MDEANGNNRLGRLQLNRMVWWIGGVLCLMGATLFVLKYPSALPEMIGSFIAFLGALLIAYIHIQREKKKGDKEQFTRLLAILTEIKTQIHRCETLIEFWKLQGKISYSFIQTPTFASQWPKINLSDLDLKVYVGIEKCYYLFGVVMYNIEKANMVNTKIVKINPKQFFKEKKVENQLQPIIPTKIDASYDVDYDNSAYHIVENHIDPSRYGSAIAFIQEFLKDGYHNFNSVFYEVKEYAKQKQLPFPKELSSFTSDYIIYKTERYDLKNNRW